MISTKPTRRIRDPHMLDRLFHTMDQELSEPRRFRPRPGGCLEAFLKHYRNDFRPGFISFATGGDRNAQL